MRITVERTADGGVQVWARGHVERAAFARLAADAGANVDAEDVRYVHVQRGAARQRRTVAVAV